jgi:ATP-dependent helicase/nuclease subunit B
VRRQLLVPFGPEATECLVELVREAKAGEPLAPVTVAVPGSYAGLALRRALAAHPTTTATPGLVNVRFLALARVAELLGAPTLAIDARPLTDALRADAVRRVLADGVGALGGRARHPQTERSVEASLAELRRADPATIARLAKVEPAGRRAVELLRAYESATAGTYDDEDLQLSGARAAREQPGRLRETGPVIVHLPRELSAAEQELLDAIATASGVAVIHGLTGEEEADASTLGLADRLEDLLGPAVRWVPAGDAPEAEPRKARVTRFLAAPDPDEEVRAALRRVLAGPAERPLHRVALVYRDPDPYARIAHEQLEAAGVPASGASTRALADTVTGRVLLSLLALADDEFRRDTVVAWMSTAPILEAAGSGRWIPADRWNQISRDAGVIRGLEQWSERLDHHRELREAARARWSSSPSSATARSPPAPAAPAAGPRGASGPGGPSTSSTAIWGGKGCGPRGPTWRSRPRSRSAPGSTGFGCSTPSPDPPTRPRSGARSSGSSSPAPTPTGSTAPASSWARCATAWPRASTRSTSSA